MCIIYKYINGIDIVFPFEFLYSLGTQMSLRMHIRNIRFVCLMKLIILSKKKKGYILRSEVTADVVSKQQSSAQAHSGAWGCLVTSQLLPGAVVSGISCLLIFWRPFCETSAHVVSPSCVFLLCLCPTTNPSSPHTMRMLRKLSEQL